MGPVGPVGPISPVAPVGPVAPVAPVKPPVNIVVFNAVGVTVMPGVSALITMLLG
jgi:hypothetical protein